MARISISTIAIVLVASLSILAQTCVSISEAEKNEYLEAHNKARAVEGLSPLEWDGRCEAFAESYAKKRAGDCQLVHSQNKRFGENLALITAGDLSPAVAVKAWVDEKADYDYATNTCKPGKVCGHYTQVVWDFTDVVGCAKTKCPNGGTFLTCNYYPPGNFIGEKPF